MSRQFKAQEASALPSYESHALYFDSVRTLYDLLRTDHLVLASFKTTPVLLEHFNLAQLILSAETDESELGVELSLLLHRFDEHTRLADITSDAEA